MTSLEPSHPPSLVQLLASGRSLLQNIQQARMLFSEEPHHIQEPIEVCSQLEKTCIRLSTHLYGAGELSFAGPLIRFVGALSSVRENLDELRRAALNPLNTTFTPERDLRIEATTRLGQTTEAALECLGALDAKL